MTNNLKKRKFQEYIEINKDLIKKEDEEIVEPKIKKKTKKQIDKLREDYNKAWRGKSTKFNDSDKLETLN